MDKKEFASGVFNYLHLVGLYLNKKTASDFKVDDSNISFYVGLSKHHSLMAIFYKALKSTKADISEDNLKKLEEYYLSNVRKSALFAKERKDIYKFLNDNQIDFLPLKGIVIKDFYLDPDTREFADNDILFTASKDKLVKEFFVKKGYKVETFRRGNHDVYQKKPFFNFEMHRDLFAEREDGRAFSTYFKDYLKNSSIKDGYEHYLNKEDFYIYFLAHAFKHFDNSGCGIRTLIDFYLYLKNNELDFDYINKELEMIGLLDFSNKLSSLSIKVFDEEELDEEEIEMLLFIASSGTYGTLANSVAKGVKEKGRFRYLMRRIFPPMSFYKTAYPRLYKTKVLIPVAWFMRLFRIIFKNPKRATAEIKLISKTKKEKKSD
ncbi:MAG: nucleotidyltransferase family protein [Bacilli bacterium]|nr:nucleotidyltransferase family protein [Bacilli bacterium]